MPKLREGQTFCIRRGNRSCSTWHCVYHTLNVQFCTEPRDSESIKNLLNGFKSRHCLAQQLSRVEGALLQCCLGRKEKFIGVLGRSATMQYLFLPWKLAAGKRLLTDHDWTWQVVELKSASPRSLTVSNRVHKNLAGSAATWWLNCSMAFAPYIGASNFQHFTCRPLVQIYV